MMTVFPGDHANQAAHRKIAQSAQVKISQAKADIKRQIESRTTAQKPRAKKMHNLNS